MLRIFVIQVLLNLIKIYEKFLQIFLVSVDILFSRISFFPGSVDQLENSFKAFSNMPYALTVNNATNGLFLAYGASKKIQSTVLINPLVIPSNYVGAQAHGIKILAGEIDETNLSFDLEKLPSGKFDIICVTHYFGYCCDMIKLSDWCKEKKVLLIEDCSHCHGGEYAGRPLGSFGDIAVFSLQGSKFVSGGEGGVVVCRSSDHFRFMCQAAYQDKWLKRYHRQIAVRVTETFDFGLKFRIHPLAARLALVQLKTMNLRNNLIRKILNHLCLKQPEKFIKPKNKLKIGGFCNGLVLRGKMSASYIYQRNYVGYLEKQNIGISEQGFHNLEKIQNNLSYTDSSVFTNPIRLLKLLKT